MSDQKPVLTEDQKQLMAALYQNRGRYVAIEELSRLLTWTSNKVERVMSELREYGYVRSNSDN